MSEGPAHEGNLTTALHSKFDPSPPPEGSFTATVIEGPAGTVGRSVTIDASKTARVVIGHGAGCDLIVEDRAISNRHVALEMMGRRLRINDLGSKNGTFVDGVAVVRALLAGGGNGRPCASLVRLAYRPAGARA